MNEVRSPGKSGSFFYYTHDYRFIIKTIRHAEYKYLLQILPKYFRHIMEYPNSHIVRIFGLFRLSMGGMCAKNNHFVVMSNIFPPEKPLLAVYDLKGSSKGRKVHLKEMKNFVVMKDLNWVESKQKLAVSTQQEQAFMTQLQNDVRFLADINVMDYSLLVGLVVKGQQMAAESPLSPNRRDPYLMHGLQDCEYYVGIIDVLTQYGTRKRAEHLFCSCCGLRNELSAINPTDYSERFVAFLRENLF